MHGRVCVRFANERLLGIYWYHYKFLPYLELLLDSGWCTSEPVRMASYDFLVTLKVHELVTAAVAVHDHWLPMSNLDLVAPILDFGSILCYKNTNGKGNENSVDHLKTALSQVLVFFYPLAGEIVQNSHGEPEILCNNRGAEFTHAYADVQLKEINFYRSNESVNERLVPVKKKGVLSVQVTDLKCGGVIIGCTFDHRVVDGYAAAMFLMAWAEIAQAKPLTRLPSFRRSLLNPRRPPQPDQSIDKLYVPFHSMSPPVGESNQIAARTYLIKSHEINRLQSEASSDGPRRSKIESFSAFLWKIVAAAGSDLSVRSRLCIVVDGRNQLRSAISAPLESYIGNVFSAPYAEVSVGDLQTTTLKEATRELHECVSPASAADHFLSVIDWVEVRRPRPIAMKMLCGGEENATAGASIIVSALVRFRFWEIDFGWGGADYGSFCWTRATVGHVSIMSSASLKGDWIVTMEMKPVHLDFIEAREPHVFRPFQLFVDPES